MTQKIKLAYFGDHRCASTWFLSVVGAICRDLNLSLVKYEDWIGLTDPVTVDIIADVNANWDHRVIIGTLRGFHVIRDPRDIVVSAYFSHKYSHPDGKWLTEQRKLLRQVSV